MKSKALYFIVLALMLITCKKPVPDIYGRIEGTITDSKSGKAVAAALVTISPTNSSVLTDNAGKYTFVNLVKGEYTLSITKDDYEDNSKIVTVFTGETSFADIILVPVLHGITANLNEVSFAENDKTKSIIITNTSANTLNVSCTSDKSYFAIEPKTFALQPNKTQIIQLTVNREGFTTGQHNSNIVLNSDVNSLTINIVVNVAAANTLATVTTDSTKLVNASTALLYGNLTDLGGAVVNDYGHCWSTVSGTPTISDTKSSLGATQQKGSYSSTAINLETGKKYYVRAYATNTIGTTYGQTIEMQSAKLPTIENAESQNITINTATISAKITNNGGLAIDNKGFCWSVQQSPTVANSSLVVADKGDSFSAILVDLQPNTTYYVRAFAKNDVGVAYSNQITIKTLSVSYTVTDFDGNIYTVIQIGNQVWLRENLKSLHYADGAAITGVYAANNSENNVSDYGRLYSWEAAMRNVTVERTQGVCPTGWHLPNDTEWYQLENYLDNTVNNTNTTGWRGTDAGTKLKNSTEFDAKLAGYRNLNSNFVFFGETGSFWTSTQVDTQNAISHGLSSTESKVYKGSTSKLNSFSVRCVKD